MRQMQCVLGLCLLPRHVFDALLVLLSQRFFRTFHTSRWQFRHRAKKNINLSCFAKTKKKKKWSSVSAPQHYSSRDPLPQFHNSDPALETSTRKSISRRTATERTFTPHPTEKGGIKNSATPNPNPFPPVKLSCFFGTKLPTHAPPWPGSKEKPQKRTQQQQRTG